MSEKKGKRHKREKRKQNDKAQYIDIYHEFHVHHVCVHVRGLQIACKFGAGTVQDRDATLLTQYVSISVQAS